jgi:hypothetical protein
MNFVLKNKMTKSIFQINLKSLTLKILKEGIFIITIFTFSFS